MSTENPASTSELPADSSERLTKRDDSVDEAKTSARREVDENPRHSDESLFALLNKWYPDLTDAELNAAIKYGLDQ